MVYILNKLIPLKKVSLRAKPNNPSKFSSTLIKQVANGCYAGLAIPAGLNVNSPVVPNRSIKRDA